MRTFPLAAAPLLALLGCPKDDLAVDKTGDDDDTGTPTPTTESGPTGDTAVPPTGDTGPTTVPYTVTVTTSGNERMVLERRYAVTASDARPLELVCTSPDDVFEDHHLALPAGSGNVTLYGILPETAYHCELVDVSASGTGAPTAVWAEDFATAPLPAAEFPELLMSLPNPARAHADDGYLLFVHWRQDVRPRVFRAILVDNLGRVRWYQALLEAGSAGIAAEWDHGEMVIGGGTTVKPSFRDLSGAIRWEYPAPRVPQLGYHHEARRTADGQLIGIEGYQSINADGEPFEQFDIQIRDPATGAVTWNLDSADLIAAGILQEGGDFDPDPFHANAAVRVTDAQGDAVWVSLRGQQRVLRVDYATGRVTDVMGHSLGLTLRDPGGRVLSETGWPFVTHQPVIQGDTMVVYDNGAGRPGAKYSRIAAFRRDSATEWTSLWEHRETGWYEPNYGSIESLPDDHWLVGSGHDLDTPAAGGVNRRAFVFEYDAVADEVVYRATFGEPGDSIYRADFVPACEIFANRRYCPVVP